MKLWLASAALIAASSFAHASSTAITVYQDPNCGCCNGWVEHMRESGFDITAIKTADMASVKQKRGVPLQLGSCHTAVVQATGQIIEGHVPANVVNKLLVGTRHAPECARYGRAGWQSGDGRLHRQAVFQGLTLRKATSIPGGVPYTDLRSRRALKTTEAELRLIANAANMGESKRPTNGYRTPEASGTPRAL